MTDFLDKHMRRDDVMKMYTKRTPIKASKDYADLKGMDFTKARDLLTKDGFYEHEYGDKDDNNGYAVYRKGDKEVELQYRWIPGKRKGDAHAGKVTNVYVDEDIYGACGKKSVKASNEGRSDLIYVIMVNGNPVAKGSYDAMVKKSYTYNYPVQMLKFPKAKLNSLIKMAKDAHRPDPLKFAVNRFINDNTSEYDSLNSATNVRSRRAIKASGRQLIFPFIVEGEFADGYTCEVGGNSEAECIEKLGNMESKHGELVWYSGVTDENYEAGKSVYSSSNLRRVTASTKYRIDIYKRNNPDALIKRVYEMFDSEDEAYEYGESIANGNEVVVNKVNASTKANTIKASTAPKRYEVAIDRGENESLLVKFFDNQDDAFNYADSVHDRGFAVRITDNETGETEELGEFESYWNTMTDVESCDNSVTASELSLNLNAEPRWEEWVAYGYDVTGEDVTTDSIDFQDDFRSFITDMFRRYPEIDTIDVYKRGSYENDEYFQTFTRDDVRDMLADAIWNIQHGDVESSVCASTSNQIPYDMVSTLVILRDYANVEDEDYINNEHKLLVDIADTLYNVGRGMVTNLSGEYKNLYEMYGEDYFDKVLDDVTAIDSQMSDQNLNDLIEDYNNRIAAY